MQPTPTLRYCWIAVMLCLAEPLSAQWQDLVVESSSRTPATVCPLDPVTLMDTALNNSEAHGMGQFRVSWYISTDADVTTSDRLWISHWLPDGLNAYERQTWSAQAVWPDAPPFNTPGATYYVAAIVDDRDDRQESNETNNRGVVWPVTLNPTMTCRYRWDCNGNSVSDPLDIGEGVSQDCNGNGLPDECDTNTGPLGNSWALLLMDEGGGNEVLDSSGNGHHGESTGVVYSTDAPFARPGDYSLLFDARGDRVDLPFFASPPEALTLEAFIQPEDTAGVHIIFYSPFAFTLSIHENRLWFTVARSASALAHLDAPFPRPPQTKDWTHVAAVYSGKGMALYRDGILLASNTETVGVLGPASPPIIRIGNDQSADEPGAKAHDLRGRIDQVRIVNAALPFKTIARDAEHSFFRGTSVDTCGNGIPDECELDSDHDLVVDSCDNCPHVGNHDQKDTDGDGIGDACDDMVAPLLTAAVSRKTHGARGNFDIPLSMGAVSAAAVECRAGGPRWLVLTFSEPVKAVDGTLDGSEIGLSAGVVNSVERTGLQLQLHLAGVPDQTCLMISLTGLADAAGNPLAGENRIRVRTLQGDCTQDGVVASADITQLKARSGQEVSASNFRFDITADGVIASADITQTKARSGNTASCP